MGRLLASTLAAGAAYVSARPLTDAELTYFHGYSYMAGPTRPLPTPLAPSESLKEAAQKAGVYIGAAINYGGMQGTSYGAVYPNTALSQFSLYTAENECKVGPIHPQPTQYAYDQCDYLMGTGIKNGSVVRFHNTCWGGQNPGWLEGMKDPVQLRQALRDHIGNITAHYLANPALAYYAIDVVNEAVSDSGNDILKNVVPWYPAVPDYLNVGFTAAGAAAATTGLKPLFCYNDYGAEGASYPKAAKVLTLVKQLLAAGAPVSCVGLQMHISVDQKPTKEDISANIKQFGDLNITVHITEMDVKCPNCDAARLQAQAQVYTDVLEACLENTNCASFEVWGLFDNDSWVGAENAPLLWDVNWQPKPAYSAVLATLQAHAAKRGYKY